MKKITTMFLILMLLLVGGCGYAATEPPNDAAKKTHTPKIIATTVASTEIMDQLDLPLIGVPTTTKELPSRYQKVEAVGSPMGPDLELMRTLQPDLILSTKTLEADLAEGLTNANLKTKFLDFRSIAKMEQEISALGNEFDRKQQAKTLNQSIEKQIKDVQKKYEGKEQPTVLILMGIPGSYLVVTENAYLGDLVKRAGGKNIIEGQKQEYLASNTEFLQQANPDIIIRAAHGMPKEVVEMFDAEFKKNDIWQHFNAVKNKRVYDLDENLFGMTASLNAPEALAQLAEILYEK